MISKQRQNTTADLSTKSWELQNCLRGAFDTSRPVFISGMSAQPAIQLLRDKPHSGNHLPAALVETVEDSLP